MYGSRCLARLLVFAALGISLTGIAVVGQEQPPRKPGHKQNNRRRTGAPPRKNNPGRAAQASPGTFPAAPQNSPANRIRNPRVLLSGDGVPRGRRPIEHSPEEIAARELLRMMLKPTADYVGVRQTVEYGANTITSEQEVEGDTKGNLLIKFLSPEKYAGDVLVISPNRFRSYHHARNEEDVATWPTDWNDEVKNLFAALNRSVIARKIGEETVAGRKASIVVLSTIKKDGTEGPVLRKFWIDQETGIQLKIEKLRADTGAVTSTTTMTNITLKPVNPQDFKPRFPGAKINPLYPPEGPLFYHNLAEAQGHLPVQPLIPTVLPPGYTLDGIWSFPARPNLRAVLLRFTNGVASFSLFEHRALAPNAQAKPPAEQVFRHAQQHWILDTSQGLVGVEYIGHLSAEEAKSLYESLR